MFDFFDKIIGTVELLLSFFFNLIDGLMKAVLVMTNGVAFVLRISGLMPTFIASSIIIVLFMAVLKFLIGR